MRYFSKAMKNIRSCQPENKPESTKIDQHVEIPKKCFGDGISNRHKCIGDMILGEKINKYDMVFGDFGEIQIVAAVQ